ncbi:RNA-directed DNA polymerase (Reverse transcriptase), partial [Trifolium medium]|nr:RNA-directed DNA polymerase (Reverse transcriptase) [Trifolium medium]
MSASSTYTLCSLHDEYFLHCIWDREFSHSLWNHIGFNNLGFFSNMNVYDWLKQGVTDGSCIGSPVRSGFGSIIRNTFGHYLAGFPGFIQGFSDILLAELYAIYKGLLLAKNMSVLMNLFATLILYIVSTSFKDADFLTHVSPPNGVRDLLRNDAMGTLFLR